MASKGSTDNAQALLGHYRRLADKLHRRLTDHHLTDDAELIHKLRVSIKKIRAILSLIMEIDKQAPVDDYLASLKHIFRPAGKLRETQISLILIAGTDKPGLGTFRKYLERRADKQLRRFKKAVERLDNKALHKSDRAIDRWLQGVDETFMVEQIRSNIESRQILIRSLIPGMSDKDNLHRIRINVRALSEMFTLLHDMQPDSTLKAQLDEIKSILDVIGTWHDYDVLLVSLFRFIDRHPDEVKLQTTARMQELEQELASRKQAAIDLLSRATCFIKPVGSD